MKVAIYPNGTTISILFPAPNCGLTLEQICQKDVPMGVKYKIIDSSEIPTDMELRNTWEYDFTNFYDGVGAGSV